MAPGAGVAGGCADTPTLRSEALSLVGRCSHGCSEEQGESGDGDSGGHSAHPKVPRDSRAPRSIVANCAQSLSGPCSLPAALAHRMARWRASYRVDWSGQLTATRTRMVLIRGACMVGSVGVVVRLLQRYAVHRCRVSVNPPLVGVAVHPSRAHVASAGPFLPYLWLGGAIRLSKCRGVLPPDTNNIARQRIRATNFLKLS